MFCLYDLSLADRGKQLQNHAQNRIVQADAEFFQSGLKAGQYACFPGGGGGVGIQGVQLAHAMGMRPIVIDSGEEKRELAKKMGAEAFVDFKTSSNVAEDVKKAAGGVGAHGVFVTAPSAYKTAVDLTGDRVGAVVMCTGLRKSSAYAFLSRIDQLTALSSAQRLDYPRHRPNLFLLEESHNEGNAGGGYA